MNATVAHPPRYGFLDLYRGIIVLFMLQGHVVREVIGPDLRAGAWFTFHELFHGITAPGFLFGAGFTFAISTQRKWDLMVAWNLPLLRRLWRLLTLIATGYLLHVPFLSLTKTLSTATAVQWREFLMFDALQCIALTLLFLRLLIVIVRNERTFLLVTISFLFAIVYLTPIAWQPGVRDSMPLAVSSMLNGLDRSLFPLFPYAGYLLAGVLVSWIFLRAASNDAEDVYMKRFAAGGVLLVAAGFLFDLLPVSLYPSYDFWNASPNYFWIKLGVLLLLLSLLWFVEESLLSGPHPHNGMPPWLLTIGVESLFVYILHLILLYGWVINSGLNMRAWWSGSLGWWGMIGATAGLVVACALAAQVWRHLKKQHPVLMRGVYAWTGFCVVYAFLFNPY